MRTIFVLFDSLVRGALQCYGGQSVHAPNFQRFAERAVTFASPRGGQGQGGGYEDTTTVLFDLQADHEQRHPLHDAAVETRLPGLMRDPMRANEAPPEAFTRLGLQP